MARSPTNWTLKRPVELAATGSEGLRCSTSWNWVVAGGGGGGDEGGSPVELVPAEVLESVGERVGAGVELVERTGMEAAA